MLKENTYYCLLNKQFHKVHNTKKEIGIVRNFKDSLEDETFEINRRYNNLKAEYRGYRKAIKEVDMRCYENKIKNNSLCNEEVKYKKGTNKKTKNILRGN